eukprot:3939797-Rhodomonas_salina.2
MVFTWAGMLSQDDGEKHPRPGNRDAKRRAESLQTILKARTSAFKHKVTVHKERNIVSRCNNSFCPEAIFDMLLRVSDIDDLEDTKRRYEQHSCQREHCKQLLREVVCGKASDKLRDVCLRALLEADKEYAMYLLWKPLAPVSAAVGQKLHAAAGHEVPSVWITEQVVLEREGRMPPKNGWAVTVLLQEQAALEFSSSATVSCLEGMVYANFLQLLADGVDRLCADCKVVVVGHTFALSCLPRTGHRGLRNAGPRKAGEPTLAFFDWVQARSLAPRTLLARCNITGTAAVRQWTPYVQLLKSLQCMPEVDSELWWVLYVLHVGHKGE